jgi:hypothetical protein
MRSHEPTILEGRPSSELHSSSLGPDETKAEAFQRLAEKRTNAALDKIRVIGNLSNPYAYEYTDEDVRLIFAALDQEIRVTKAKFHSARRREFKLR